MSRGAAPRASECAAGERLGPAAVVLRGFAAPYGAALAAGLDAVTAQSPFRHMVTRGGYAMSVAMTNCGPLGWVSDSSGYRYSPVDPLTGGAWPPMPEAFAQLATEAAAAAGFPEFAPDCCLINRYAPGTQLSLHQDKDERDFTAPIVSVSLGVPAVFLFGGLRRAERPQRIPLRHGDVVVWGGPDRLRYHGVARLPSAEHPFAGPCRLNLTFRRAA